MFAVVLLVASVWPSTYFWTHTRSGQAQLHAAIVNQFDQDLLHFDAFGWGPAPNELWLRGVVIRDVQDKPGLTAETMTLEFDVTRTLTTGLDIRRATARGVGVHLAWDADGAFNLNRRWLAPSLEPPTRPRRDRPPATVQGIVLEDALVTLAWPTWSLRFEDVHAAGGVEAGGGRPLTIGADLSGRRASVTVEGRTTEFETHRIQGFAWEGRGFQTDGVTLVSADGHRVFAAGEMGFRRGASTTIAGEVTLPPPGEHTLLATWVPGGGRVGRVDVRREHPGPWAMTLTEASVPTLAVGSVRVTGLQASLQGEWGAGALLPHLAVETRGASATGLEVGSRVAAESIAIDHLDVSLGASVDASVTGLGVGALTLEGQTVRDIAFDGAVVANVGGGEIKGTLATGSGTATIAGPLETSVLRRRVDASMTMTFDALRGGLASWLRRGLPPAERAEGAAALTGRATARLALPASGPVAWSWTSVDWVEGAP